MSKANTKLLLEVALNEEATSEELTKAWNNTKSIKVRKAIASNPNASPEVLRQAARLYIEEVLKNPGFEMMTLFGADEWVEQVHSAFTDPDAHIRKGGHYYAFGGGYGANRDVITKAMLLSKNLTHNVLDTCIRRGSLSALDRVCKDPLVKGRITAVAMSQSGASAYNKISLESMMVLFARDLITFSQLERSLSTYVENSGSGKNSMFRKFFIRAILEYSLSTTSMTDRRTIVKAVGRVLSVSRHHITSWFCNEVLVKKGSAFDLAVSVLAEVEGGGPHKSKYNSLYQVLGEAMRSKLEYSDKKPGDYEALYSFIASNNFVAGCYKRKGVVTLNRGDAKEVMECSLEAREFFLKSECFGTIVTARSGDHLYELFKKTNDDLYDSGVIGYKLIYSYCDISGTVSTRAYPKHS